MRICALAMALVCALLPARADTVYAALGNGDILAVNSATLSSTVLARTNITWYDIAYGPDGRLYGSDAYGLFLIDPGNGQSSLIGSFGVFINGMTFLGETLYGSGTSGLYTIDVSNGQTRLLGSTGYDSSGDLEWYQGALYLTGSGTHSDRLLRVDPGSGRGTLVGSIGVPWVYGLAATDSALLGFTGRGEILEIDVTSGTGRHLGWVAGTVNGASSKPANGVPEPWSLGMLAAGWLMLAAMRRR